jgi:hypothetical protein
LFSSPDANAYVASNSGSRRQSSSTLSGNGRDTGLRARKIDPNGKINAFHEVNLYSCVTASKFSVTQYFFV